MLARMVNLSSHNAGPVRRFLVGVVYAAAMILALSFRGCSGVQRADGTSAWRAFTHELAVGYCFVHRVGEPLILVATAVYPPMVIPKQVADAFCASVNGQQAALTEEAAHVLPAGEHPLIHPTYTLGPEGFTLRTP